MHWKVVISRTGAEAAGMSDPSDWADLLSPNTDLSSAVASDENGRCPQCNRHPSEYLWRIFADEPASTPDQVTGPVFVMCLGRHLYRYAGVHAVDDRPIGEASVRAALVSRTPGTGALQIDGQVVPPVVVEEIAATDEVAVVIAPASGTVEQQSLIPTTPPEPLPPTADEPPPGQQMLVVPRWYEEQRRQAVVAATNLLYRNHALYE